MTTDLLAAARAGDTRAFRDLTGPYRREILVHCYRMLGSYEDAEDAVQETLLAAWQGVGGFEERASVRTWLYRIATNRCLNARRSTARRRSREGKEWDVPGIRPPEPTGLGEVVWLQPLPGDLAEGPEARYEQRESVSLAFVTALQLLPPRQVAVVVLRDVLGFSAREVAEMLDTTTESVTSALKRARATLRREARSDRAAPPAAGSPAESVLVSAFVAAYEASDVDAVVALLTDDVLVSMPPVALEYEGREAAAAFCAAVILPERTFRLVPTRANGQPAFGIYLLGPDGVFHGTGLLVLALTGDRVCALTRFESGTLAWFGLPRALPYR